MNVYASPSVRPPTSNRVASVFDGAPSTFVVVSCAVTVYETTGPPPFTAGTSQLTAATPSPAAATTVVGAPGGETRASTDTESDTVAVSFDPTDAGGTTAGASAGDTDSSTTIVTGGSTVTASETETDSTPGTLAGGETETASLVPTGSSLPTPAGGDAVGLSPDATLSSTTIETGLDADGTAPAGSTSRPRPHASASSSSAHRTAALLPVRRPATVIPRSPSPYEKLRSTVTEMSWPDRIPVIGAANVRSVISL